MILVLMGVTGVGKTAIGTLRSARTGWKFEDADDYHSEENRRKMAPRTPLTDADRGAWLHALHGRMLQYRQIRQSAILACSALKQQYRELLAGGFGKGENLGRWQSPKSGSADEDYSPHERAVIFEYLHIVDVWARPKLFKLLRPHIDHGAQPR